MKIQPLDMVLSVVRYMSMVGGRIYEESFLNNESTLLLIIDCRGSLLKVVPGEELGGTGRRFG